MESTRIDTGSVRLCYALHNNPQCRTPLRSPPSVATESPTPKRGDLLPKATHTNSPPLSTHRLHHTGLTANRPPRPPNWNFTLVRSRLSATTHGARSLDRRDSKSRYIEILAVANKFQTAIPPPPRAIPATSPLLLAAAAAAAAAASRCRYPYRRCATACLPACLSACLPICLPAYLPACLSACLPVCLFHRCCCCLSGSPLLPVWLPAAACLPACCLPHCHCLCALPATASLPPRCCLPFT